MGDEAAHLVQEIQEAFKGIRTPETLAHCDECAIWLESFSALGACSWNELPDAAISLEYHALTAATPEGWRFLAPAYMIWYIRNFQTSDSNVVGHLIFALGGDPVDEHIRQAHAALSADQRAAICSFLKCVYPRLEANGDEYLASIAKRGISYWSEVSNREHG